jgi:hypothetical protein
LGRNAHWTFQHEDRLPGDEALENRRNLVKKVADGSEGLVKLERGAKREERREKRDGLLTL